ncbi:MAG: 16S rRNA (cytidine(1402)-2'-O)-methyltransferase [Actinobacteria bacterium]|nr:16S rRNA (cytidine(1402)-2'-O)-methyltransferase [Actinomycetota bacterium]
MHEENKGALFVCGTPIGNLGDVSFRLLDTLKQADMILAEDTRTIRKLLSRYDIVKSQIISYHQHSTAKKLDSIIEELKNGKTAALVSESGMPSIQDPGYEIIGQCIREGIAITVIPGPSAATSALVLSGLPSDSFLFIGFLPKSGEKRNAKIAEISGLPYTLIFYESPKRIEKLLGELIKKLGDRRSALIREMTKIYEEAIRGRLSKVLEDVGARASIKGEIVLIVEGNQGELISEYTEDEIKSKLMNLMSQGITKKNAQKIIRSRYDIDRQKLYNISTKI